MKNRFLVKFRIKIIFYSLLCYHPYNIRFKMIFLFCSKWNFPKNIVLTCPKNTRLYSLPIKKEGYIHLKKKKKKRILFHSTKSTSLLERIIFFARCLLPSTVNLHDGLAINHDYLFSVSYFIMWNEKLKTKKIESLVI